MGATKITDNLDGQLARSKRGSAFSTVEKALATAAAGGVLVYAAAKVAATELTKEVSLGFGAGSFKVGNYIASLGGIGWNGPTGDSYAALNLTLEGTKPKIYTVFASVPTAVQGKILEFAKLGDTFWTNLGAVQKATFGNSVVYLKDVAANSATFVVQDKAVPLLAELAKAGEAVAAVGAFGLALSIALTRLARDRKERKQ